MPGNKETTASGRELATLGAGCFWCIEPLFAELKGVESAISGYAGGSTDHPTYEDICTGSTGHAEVVRVTFDPTIISYNELLKVFFAIHDPTTLNRQGDDIGTQYRSVIFYHSADQRVVAESTIRETNAANRDANPIVTEVVEAGPFYTAENYHQEYFLKNGHEPYCQLAIAPKLATFRKEFRDMLKIKLE